MKKKSIKRKFKEWDEGIKKDIPCPKCKKIMYDIAEDNSWKRWNQELICQNINCDFFGILRLNITKENS